MSTERRPIVLRAGAASDTGRVRAINQDSYAVLPDRGLYVVADGMGGARGGEVASRLAIETLEEHFVEPSADALADALAAANERIHTAAEDPDLRGMGTTAVVLAKVPDEPAPDEPDSEPAGERLLVANVGDSRAYLFRDGGLTQLTDDHSLVGELLRDGRITPEEAEVHPQRNIVTRVLGPYAQVAADLWPIDPVRGDRILLCSDGLFNEVADDQIAAVLRRLDDPREAADELVRLANEAGGRDNITVIVVDVVDDGGAAKAASDTLGAGRLPSRAVDDPAGFSTALDEPDTHQAAAPNRRARRAERRAQRREERRVGTRTRLTWRVVLYAVLVLAVVGGALATIQWYGTSTYFVGFHGDEVAIYQGRPGGLLWIEPRLEEDTGITRAEVPARYRSALEAGHQHSSLAEARRYVSNIERDIIERAEATTTTTTTAPPVTTTTVAPAG